VLTHFGRLVDLPMEELEGLYRGLEEQGMEELRRLAIGPERIFFERAADLRYVGQEHAVAVPVPASVGNETSRSTLKRTFDEAHQVRFSHSAPNEPAELVSLRVSVFGRMEKPGFPRVPAGRGDVPADVARRQKRTVVIGDEPLECVVFDRAHLLAGNRIPGPAVIEEPASTTLLEPGDLVVVNEWGHLVIQVGTG
jgi:N-methylhydantoinase A